MIPRKLTEGGNVFDDAGPIKKEFVPSIIDDIQALMPRGLTIIPHIGSAGFKVESGDMDVFVDAGTLIKLTGTKDEKTARVALRQYIEKQGYQCALTGRNVHVRMPTPAGTFVQVDVMVIPNAEKVAPFHQHGPSGQYDDPAFKGGQLFILYSSIAKALGLKFSPFEGKLVDRTTNEVVADSKDEVAKILLNPKATASDLSNVKTILKALSNDPLKDEKLAQAREDAKKGLITLPESRTQSDHWYRRTVESLEAIGEKAPSPGFVNGSVNKKEWKQLGKGMAGSVWAHISDPHTVVKIVGGGCDPVTPEEKQGAIAFVHFCVDHGTESIHFPIIHAINLDDSDIVQIRIERLKELPSYALAAQLSDLNGVLSGNYFNRKMVSVQKKIKSSMDKLDALIQKHGLAHINSAQSILNALLILEANGPHYAQGYGVDDFELDLHADNWMMRPDGTIIAVDPWYVGY